MRKRTMLILVDRLFWAIIWLIPIVAYLLSPIGYSIGGGTALTGLSGGAIIMPDFASYMAQFGVRTDNVIYQALNGLFGTDGVIHLFNSDSSIMMYFTYFVCVELLHLFVDFIIFVPRLTHKWLNILTREGDDL